MKKLYERLIQTLAITDAICFFLLVAPRRLYESGINVYKWTGNDGSVFILVSVLFLIISFAHLAGMVHPAYRTAVIPKQKTITNFFIPYSVVSGYIIWGVSVLYALSQSTDL